MCINCHFLHKRHKDSPQNQPLDTNGHKKNKEGRFRVGKWTNKTSKERNRGREAQRGVLENARSAKRKESSPNTLVCADIIHGEDMNAPSSAIQSHLRIHKLRRCTKTYTHIKIYLLQKYTVQKLTKKHANISK